MYKSSRDDEDSQVLKAAQGVGDPLIKIVGIAVVGVMALTGLWWLCNKIHQVVREEDEDSSSPTPAHADTASSFRSALFLPAVAVQR